jgi:hypothetical protein
LSCNPIRVDLLAWLVDHQIENRPCALVERCVESLGTSLISVSPFFAAVSFPS